jgi:hypothetical protein
MHLPAYLRRCPLGETQSPPFVGSYLRSCLRLKRRGNCTPERRGSAL